MIDNIAYPLLHGASLAIGMKFQPRFAPELAPKMRELARWSCRRVGMRVPHGAEVTEVMRLARVKPADEARKRALRAGASKAAAQKAWKVAYAAEHHVQQVRMTLLFADGKWEDER